ncbi:hypothetical protein Gohar_009726 [Gossypium harknessii]|uniref:Uncharacterized protein n=1 Tax=Gossypium harknessii TaxID=34285 RepID=A0A7J9GNP8_9ROSI|nr:hypothetical protein [Gossypium harknessii]
MVLQRLEICVELMKLAVEFVVVVAEAVGIVIHQNHSPPVMTASRPFATPVPLVGVRILQFSFKYAYRNPRLRASSSLLKKSTSDFKNTFEGKAVKNKLLLAETFSFSEVF